jgi:hypothetical protein
MKLIHSFLILTLLLAQMANANYFRATREINELAVEEKNVVAEEDAMWTRMVQEVNSFRKLLNLESGDIFCFDTKLIFFELSFQKRLRHPLVFPQQSQPVVRQLPLQHKVQRFQ